MRQQCINFICNITYLLGQYGDEAKTLVMQFTEFAQQGFRNAHLTLPLSASCFM